MPPRHPALQCGNQRLPDVGRSRVLLGNSRRADTPREVWFDPQNPEQPLSNPHISISGETGSGKTQAMKAILHDFLPQGLPALILDFKDDYSKSDYAAAEGFTVHDASFGSLPFNPMVPPVDPQSGRANPIAHVHELGEHAPADLQARRPAGVPAARGNEGDVRDRRGRVQALRPGSRTSSTCPFEAIRDVLVREEATQLLGRSRRSSTSDSSAEATRPQRSTICSRPDRHPAQPAARRPGEERRRGVLPHGPLQLPDPPGAPAPLERLLVLDEAWRLVKSPFLEPLMREGRAFGLGVIIATQFPRDLPDQIAGSTATRVFFNQTKAEQVREIQRTLVGKTSGTEADHLGNLIRGLAPLECILQNLHYRPWVRLRAIPYFTRVAEQGPPA